MTTSITKRIADLNDRFRRATGSSDPAGMSLGKKLMTCGIRDLDLMTTVEIAEKVQAFDSLNADNDPHGSLLPFSITDLCDSGPAPVDAAPQIGASRSRGNSWPIRSQSRRSPTRI